MFFLLLLTIIITLCYYLLKINYEYWERKGVPGPKPTFLAGNLAKVLLCRQSFGEAIAAIYNAFPDASIVGIFRAGTPTLIIRDPDVIKHVSVKDFDHFHDNDFNIKPEVDPLFGRNPFVLKGEKWKTTRTKLTPSFTSGKVKIVYPLLEDVSERLVRFIDTQPEASNGVGLEAKELCAKFTLNNVASCAFGLEGGCFEDPNAEFRQIANRFLTPTGWNSFKLFMANTIPILWRIFDIRFTPKDVEDKLIEIVTHAIKYREQNSIKRNDFLDLMNQQRHSIKDVEFDMVDIVAHAAGFFVDGYESSSIVMSFILYELAANLDAQSRLREEIVEIFSKNNGKLTYEDIQEMQYLDAVFNESLRLHPILLTLGKLCTKDYTFNPKPGDLIKNPVVIEKDTPIIIPVLALHTDGNYFEKPNEFLPERFLGENKEKITKYSYLPFGEGPRICLGKRFGILQVKIGIAYIIRNFKINVNEKTKRPLKINPQYFLLSPIGGLWINFKKIDD